MNFGRTFRIKERVTLNVRVEFANAFNRLQLPQVNSAPNSLTKVTTQTAPGIYQGAITGGFGVIGGAAAGFAGPAPFPIAGTSGYRTGLLVGRLQF